MNFLNMNGKDRIKFGYPINNSYIRSIIKTEK